MNFIPNNLKVLRKLTGLSQSEFAERVGLNRGNITSYERGVAQPGISAIQRMAAYFNVDMLEFIQTDLSKKMDTLRIPSPDNTPNSSYAPPPIAVNFTETQTGFLPNGNYEGTTPSMLKLNTAQPPTTQNAELLRALQQLSQQLASIATSLDKLVKNTNTLLDKQDKKPL
jgi:transcriptional regulator with XRE-family HTH domain